MTPNDANTIGGPSLAVDGARLVGRAAERARIGHELDQVRAGHSAVLVLRGRPGLGKTALLNDAVRKARAFRVLRSQAVQSEAGLAYAGLQLLCTPLLPEVRNLHPTEREALATAVGITRGPEPDQLLVCRAVLNLLMRAAVRQPVLCVIDDVQWLDPLSLQALAFAARRLEEQPVMVLLAARHKPHLSELDGLPEVELSGLTSGDACRLLSRVVPGRLDKTVVDRVIAEARGNPLAVLELGHAAAPAELAGGFGVATTGEEPRSIDDDYMARVGRLPEDNRKLLLLAAAEPCGNPALLWRAAESLGVPRAAAGALECAELLSFGARVRFPRPRLRLQVYESARNDERRALHRALGSATDADSQADWRAWHLAHAADGPDEELAQALERFESRARDRGGLAAAAAFLEQAALLTADPARRSERALVAAAYKHQAGADYAAARLLVTAEMGSPQGSRRLRLERQRAQLEVTDRGGDPVESLLTAARRLEGSEPALAREAYLEALGTAMYVRRPNHGPRPREIAAAAQAGPAAPTPPRPHDLLLDALARRCTHEPGAQAGLLANAVAALHAASGDGTALRWRWLAGQVAADLGDLETWHAITSSDLRLHRDTGAVSDLVNALNHRAVADVLFGDTAAAADLIDEAEAITSAIGATPITHASLLLAGWLGQEDAARRLWEKARRQTPGRGNERILATVGLAEAVLYNGQGRYEEALVVAREAIGIHGTDLAGLGLSSWLLVEMIEAAARAGNPEDASIALEQLSERSRVGGDWAHGAEASARALLTDGPDAEKLYREAIDRLGRTRASAHRARAELLYGEWLRRHGRRIDARTPLRTAYQVFSNMEAAAFAQRAHRELLATGERARSRSVETDRQLTPQEARIAQMAYDGLTNPEIGERLFVSPRTVEYHLHKVFAKLGITSRSGLHRALPRALALASSAAGSPTPATPRPSASAGNRQT
jgi:DNA-binding CsgD family transcriptional regulator